MPWEEASIFDLFEAPCADGQLRSPWGTCCTTMPDFTWIDGKTNFFPSSSYNIRELTFRKSSDPYDQWGPELNDDQQAQVEAGFDLLTSLWSNQLLSDLTAQLAATNATSPTPAGTDLLRVVWRVYNRLLEPTIIAPAGVDEFLTPPAGPHVALRRGHEVHGGAEPRALGVEEGEQLVESGVHGRVG